MDRIHGLDSPGTSHARLVARTPGSSSSGLTLVLPSLKALKAKTATASASTSTGISTSTSSASRKGKTPAPPPPDPEPKVPRPLKLKPLKEVLTKLIHQIKKKDDYAFFLNPVNVSQVPGYLDIIKQPMDFGTMTRKVERGKYRSLEDFTNDFRLVITNAKIFNPPGSIYHTEAERIETWGMDHIAKAAPTVIQYEADWNIDIEKDEDVSVTIDDDDDKPAPAFGGEEKDKETPRRSVSVVSQTQPTRRRGPYKRQHHHNTNHNTGGTSQLSEQLDPDGGLPGSKDGLGAFPPGSDWAKMMLFLKLKGKRYRTKKERIRFEKEGPPYLPDGSLDYTEMEDPYSVLSSLAPDPLTRPYLTPLFPPPPPTQPTATQPQAQTPIPSTPAQAFYSYNPNPTSATQSPIISQPPSAFPPQTPTQSTYPTPTPEPSSSSSSLPAAVSLGLTHVPPQLGALPELQNTKRKHWYILKNTNARLKGRDHDLLYPAGNEEVEDDHGREAGVLDWGAMALLSGEIAEEMRRRGVGGGTWGTGGTGGGGEREGEEKVLEVVRESLGVDKMRERAVSLSKIKKEEQKAEKGKAKENEGYFTSERAIDAEDYLREVVYGGVDGFAYVRSLAEFVCPPEDGEGETPTPTPRTTYPPNSLGMPLAKWVEKNIVDPLTEGRHSILRETAEALSRIHLSPPPSSSNHLTDAKPTTSSTSPTDPLAQITTSLSQIAPTLSSLPSFSPEVLTQLLKSLYVYPIASSALDVLKQIREHKIDMAALIKRPEELFVSEEEWAGKGVKERKRKRERRESDGDGEREGKRVKIEDGDEGVKVEEVASDLSGGVDGKAGSGMAQEEEEEDEDEKKVLREEEEGEKESTWMASSTTMTSADASAAAAQVEMEGPEELGEVLDYVAGVIGELDRRIRGISGESASREDVVMADATTSNKGDGDIVTSSDKVEETQAEPQAQAQAQNNGTAISASSANTTSGTTTSATQEEDPTMRNLRLNLLALAKRAPLDTIARLPEDLVPEHIRNFVPTLGSSSN